MSTSERIYCWFLRLYPREYRLHYGEPMQQLFRDGLREARDFPAVFALCRRIIADLAISIPQEHLGRWKFHGKCRHDAATRQCLLFARHEASSFAHHEIGIEHLLLGIVRQEPGLVDDPEEVVREVEAHEAVSRRVPSAEDLRLSWVVIRVWVSAAAIASRAGRPRATPRDLVTAILGEKDTWAGGVLSKHLTDR